MNFHCMLDCNLFNSRVRKFCAYRLRAIAMTMRMTRLGINRLVVVPVCELRMFFKHGGYTDLIDCVGVLGSHFQGKLHGLFCMSILWVHLCCQNPGFNLLSLVAAGFAIPSG